MAWGRVRVGVSEVKTDLCGSGGHVCEELHFDAAEGFTAECDVEEDDGVALAWRCHDVCRVRVAVFKLCRLNGRGEVRRWSLKSLLKTASVRNVFRCK